MKIPPQKRHLILSLAGQNVGKKEIARLLQVNPKTVRRVLQKPSAPDPSEPASPDSSLPPQTASLVRDLFARLKGNARRVEEELRDSYHCEVPYSTLTRAIRDLGLRDTQPSRSRSGSYTFAPGDEMQHDTSPHRVVIAGKSRVTRVAPPSSLPSPAGSLSSTSPRLPASRRARFLRMASRLWTGSAPA